MNTLVVMVEPSALAETVTPPILSPAAEVTVPLKITPLAYAVGPARETTNANRATAESVARVMASLLERSSAQRLSASGSVCR